PRAVSAMHANCPFPEERMALAESIYEEETGRISGCNQPHPEIFLRFGEAVGLSRGEMIEGRPLRATRSLIDWFELSTKQRSFIEAAAAMNLAAEGQVSGAFGPMARRLQEELRAEPRGGRVLGRPRARRCGAQRGGRQHRRPPCDRCRHPGARARRATALARRLVAVLRRHPGRDLKRRRTPWPHTSSHSTS